MSEKISLDSSGLEIQNTTCIVSVWGEKRRCDSCFQLMPQNSFGNLI